MSKRKTDERESFVMYKSFVRAARKLPSNEYKEFMERLFDYAFDGIDTPSDNPYVESMMEMAKPNIDASHRRYNQCIENGNKGKEHG